MYKKMLIELVLLPKGFPRSQKQEGAFSRVTSSTSRDVHACTCPFVNIYIAFMRIVTILSFKANSHQPKVQAKAKILFDVWNSFF